MGLFIACCILIIKIRQRSKRNAYDVSYSCSREEHVVKASGLAAGKGVIVATTKKDACDAARNMLKVNIW